MERGGSVVREHFHWQIRWGRDSIAWQLYLKHTFGRQCKVHMQTFEMRQSHSTLGTWHAKSYEELSANWPWVENSNKILTRLMSIIFPAKSFVGFVSKYPDNNSTVAPIITGLKWFNTHFTMLISLCCLWNHWKVYYWVFLWYWWATDIYIWVLLSPATAIGDPWPWGRDDEGNIGLDTENIPVDDDTTVPVGRVPSKSRFTNDSVEEVSNISTPLKET